MKNAVSHKVLLIIECYRGSVHLGKLPEKGPPWDARVGLISDAEIHLKACLKACLFYVADASTHVVPVGKSLYLGSVPYSKNVIIFTIHANHPILTFFSITVTLALYVSYIYLHKQIKVHGDVFHNCDNPCY
jgi:hypothetical protein